MVCAKYIENGKNKKNRNDIRQKPFTNDSRQFSLYTIENITKTKNERKKKHITEMWIMSSKSKLRDWEKLGFSFLFPTNSHTYTPNTCTCGIQCIHTQKCILKILNILNCVYTSEHSIKGHIIIGNREKLSTRPTTILTIYGKKIDDTMETKIFWHIQCDHSYMISFTIFLKDEKLKKI